MGFLMFLARKIQLQNQDNNIQFQLTSITNKLQEYTDFASILSQDSISLVDIAAMPASLFSDGFAYLMEADTRAAQMSEQMFNAAVSSGAFGTNPNQMVMNITKQKMYENARKQIQKQLSQKLNEEEKSLQARKTRLETQAKMIQQELQAMDQNIANGIKNQVSTYGLQG